MQNIVCNILHSCLLKINIHVYMQVLYILQKWLKQGTNTDTSYIYICERYNEIISLACLALHVDSFWICFLLLFYFTPGIKREFKHHNVFKLAIPPDQSRIPDFLALQAEPDTSYNSFMHNRANSQSSVYSFSLNVTSSPKRTMENGFSGSLYQ